MRRTRLNFNLRIVIFLYVSMLGILLQFLPHIFRNSLIETTTGINSLKSDYYLLLTFSTDSVKGNQP